MINSSKIARSPYAFTAKNVSAIGVINDSDLDLTGKTGFFSWLGSLAKRVTKIFATDADFSGNVNISGDLNVSGGIYGMDWSNVTITESQISDLQNYVVNNTKGWIANFTNIYSDDWSNITSAAITNNLNWLNASQIEGVYNSSSWNRTGANVFLHYTGDSVGVGTDSPTHALNVFGTSNFSGNMVVEGDVDFNGGWENEGLSITNGDLYAQTLYVYNLSALEVTTLRVNGTITPAKGFDDSFDIGTGDLRWRDLYLSGNILANDANLAWANLSGYPSACGTDETITGIGDTITCSSISITESQISDLQNYIVNNTKGWIANFTNIYSLDWTNVTITASQITDTHAGTDITADLEEETHASEHESGGDDEITHDSLSGAGTIDTWQEIDIFVNETGDEITGGLNVSYSVNLATSGGNVGIGTTGPNSKLEVAGTFNSTNNGGSIRVDSNGNVKIGI